MLGCGPAGTAKIGLCRSAVRPVFGPPPARLQRRAARSVGCESASQWLRVCTRSCHMVQVRPRRVAGLNRQASAAVSAPVSKA
jgi:hypothetical protein